MLPLLSRIADRRLARAVGPLRLPAAGPAQQPAPSAGAITPPSSGCRAGLWHGDVGPGARDGIIADPPEILLTTPESLEAMLDVGPAGPRRVLRRRSCRRRGRGPRLRRRRPGMAPAGRARSGSSGSPAGTSSASACRRRWGTPKGCCEWLVGSSTGPSPSRGSRSRSGVADAGGHAGPRRLACPTPPR